MPALYHASAAALKAFAARMKKKHLVAGDEPRHAGGNGLHLSAYLKSGLYQHHGKREVACNLKIAPRPLRVGFAALKSGNLHAMQAWAGQSAALVPIQPAGDYVQRIWREAQALIR